MSNEEWFKLFCNNTDQAIKITLMESNNELRACWKCFRIHSLVNGCETMIPKHWMVL